MQYPQDSLQRVGALPFPGAAFDLNFQRQVAYINGEPFNLADVVQPERTGPARHIGPDGRMVEVPAQTLRLAYTPSGRPRGLIVEAGMTPLLTYSRDISNAAWTKSTGMAATATAALGPDGLFSATRITDSQAAASTRGTFSRSITIAADTTIRNVLIRVRAGTMTRIKVSLDITSGGTVSTSATINMAEGYIEATTGTTTAKVRPSALGYVEAYLTITNASGTALEITVGRPDDADDPGYFDLDEIQAQTGRTALSSLITTDTLTARAVDGPWISLIAASWLSFANGGTFYVDADVESAVFDTAMIASLNATSGHQVTFLRVNYAAAVIGRLTVSSVTQPLITFTGGNSVPATYRGVITWETNRFTGAMLASEVLYADTNDASAMPEETTITIPTLITRLDLGHLDNASHGSVCIRRVVVWPRPMSDQQITDLIV